MTEITNAKAGETSSVGVGQTARNTAIRSMPATRHTPRAMTKHGAKRNEPRNVAKSYGKLKHARSGSDVSENTSEGWKSNASKSNTRKNCECRPNKSSQRKPYPLGEHHE